jgi:hypothetical protein
MAVTCRLCLSFPKAIISSEHGSLFVKECDRVIRYMTSWLSKASGLKQLLEGKVDYQVIHRIAEISTLLSLLHQFFATNRCRRIRHSHRNHCCSDRPAQYSATAALPTRPSCPGRGPSRRGHRKSGTKSSVPRESLQSEIGVQLSFTDSRPGAHSLALGVEAQNLQLPD